VLQPVAVDTHALLHSLADMLRRTLDQRIRIEIDTAPGHPLVMADPSQLESALLNIAINARDAMPEGGTLRFRTEICEALPTGLRNERNNPGNNGTTHFVAISIADSGTGMPDDVKERAFEPFFTTKEAGRGTGLGLSTVYGFVNQSRGAVSIDSKVGQGTTVTLYLPQQQEEMEEESDAPAAMEELPGSEALPSGLRVMLVEDDSEVRKVVEAFLAALGCEVVSAATADQALSVLDAGAGPFDLLLSDIALGAGMRGTRLAAEVQQRFPQIAVLLMSGFSSELLDADREVPQSWELLRKPYSRSDLARAMAKVLAGRI
jgi:CheY-like chemotaxis protein